jgi:hypothetical protein
MINENPSDSSSDNDFQVIGNSVFHEYTIVSGTILKVSAWWPPSMVPWEPGVYQGLIKGSRGEKIIRNFIWDGTKWRSQRTGKFTIYPFEWRGLASPDPVIF